MSPELEKEFLRKDIDIKNNFYDRILHFDLKGLREAQEAFITHDFKNFESHGCLCKTCGFQIIKFITKKSPLIKCNEKDIYDIIT